MRLLIITSLIASQLVAGISAAASLCAQPPSPASASSDTLLTGHWEGRGA